MEKLEKTGKTRKTRKTSKHHRPPDRREQRGCLDTFHLIDDTTIASFILHSPGTSPPGVIFTQEFSY